MPNIKVIVQSTQTQAGVTGTQYGTAVPLDGGSSLAVQTVISNQASLNSCTEILQISNDAPDVTPSNWNDYGSSQNITANGNLIFLPTNPPPGNWVRAKYSAPTGSFDVSTTFVVKGPN